MSSNPQPAAPADGAVASDPSPSSPPEASSSANTNQPPRIDTSDPPSNNPGASTSASALELPPLETLRKIAERQEAKAKEIREARAKKYREEQQNRLQATTSRKSDASRKAEIKGEEERSDAAQLIQKNYRGYRARRELNGFGVDSGMRWVEVLKEAKYKSHTQPLSRDARTTMSPTADRQVRDRWRRVGTIAHHAGSDDTSEGEGGENGDEDYQERLQRKKTEKAEREKYAKVMGLEYFLEMVDHKHRYGSNLRRYHGEWKKADTNENFFYWLDYGEGKDLDLEDRPRKRLDTEQVRYLSREERQRYLVNIHNGQLVWAKNDKAITTSTDFRDSINGIVPVEDDTPTWREVTTGEKPEPSPPGGDSDADSLSGMSTGSAEDPTKYMNTDLHHSKGLTHKLNHVTVDAVMNHMLRKTTKKNTWIFVADTSFRLYVGIKQSGAFQHSSFLRGARVAAAGLIKVKNGQLRKLSPLSGHYAPPLRNFREFIRNLKDVGTDLSHVSLSRSYAVLLGLEGYLGAKKRVEGVERGVKDVLHPDAKKEREAKEMDMSRSAQREREVLAAQEKEKRSRSFPRVMMRRLGIEDHAGDDRAKEKVESEGTAQ